MNVDQEIRWKNEYDDFRNTLPGYARSGFSRYQGEMVYLHARQQSENEIQSLKQQLEEAYILICEQIGTYKRMGLNEKDHRSMLVSHMTMMEEFIKKYNLENGDE